MSYRCLVSDVHDDVCSLCLMMLAADMFKSSLFGGERTKRSWMFGVSPTISDGCRSPPLLGRVENYNHVNMILLTFGNILIDICTY